MACAFHFLETASWCQHFSENIFETAVKTLSLKKQKSPLDLSGLWILSEIIFCLPAWPRLPEQLRSSRERRA